MKQKTGREMKRTMQIKTAYGEAKRSRQIGRIAICMLGGLLAAVLILNGTGLVSALGSAAGADNTSKPQLENTNIYADGSDLLAQDGEMIIPTTARKVYIRSGPGFSYPVLAVAERSFAFLVNRRGIWYEVEYNGLTGYVYGASFDTAGAYRTGRLKGITVGIDPDGQVAVDTALEPISPGSRAMSARMVEHLTGRATGVQDYLINMSVAKVLKEMLELEGATVVLTKSDVESNLSNSARARLLNSDYNGTDCDIVIRVSCNSSDNTTSRGAVSLIRFDVSQTTYSVAKAILVNIAARTGIPAFGISYTTDNTFLNWNRCPAIQVEMGYLSNLSDEKILAEESYQDQISGAIRDALVEFYGMDS